MVLAGEHCERLLENKIQQLPGMASNGIPPLKWWTPCLSQDGDNQNSTGFAHRMWRDKIFRFVWECGA
jgi:hypothetical protein